MNSADLRINALRTYLPAVVFAGLIGLTVSIATQLNPEVSTIMIVSFAVFITSAWIMQKLVAANKERIGTLVANPSVSANETAQGAYGDGSAAERVINTLTRP